MQISNFSYPYCKTLSVLFTSLCLSGCASDPYRLEPALGKTVRDAMAQQTLNPEAARQRGMQSGADGVILKSAIDRYQTSYEVPPPPVNVMNIGLGNSTSTSGR
jgi:hypothetical protein